MINTVTELLPDIIAIEVPEGAHRLIMHGNLFTYIKHRGMSVTTSHTRKQLLPGTYEYLFTWPICTEKEVEVVVQGLEEFNKKMDNISSLSYFPATAYFKTLLVLNNLDMYKNYAIIKKTA